MTNWRPSAATGVVECRQFGWFAELVPCEKGNCWVVVPSKQVTTFGRICWPLEDHPPQPQHSAIGATALPTRLRPQTNDLTKRLVRVYYLLDGKQQNNSTSAKGHYRQAQAAWVRAEPC